MRAALSIESTGQLAQLEERLGDALRIKAAFEARLAQALSKAAELDKQLASAREAKALLEVELDAQQKESALLVSNLEGKLAREERGANELRNTLEAALAREQDLSATLADEKAARSADRALWSGKYEAQAKELAAERASAHSAADESRSEVARLSLDLAKAVNSARVQVERAKSEFADNAAEVAALHADELSALARQLSSEREKGKALDAERNLTEERICALTVEHERILAEARSLSSSTERSLRASISSLERDRAIYVSDSESRSSLLESRLAQAQAAISALESQKAQGLAFLSSLQAALSAREADLQAVLEDGERRDAEAEAQLMYARGESEAASAQLSLLEARVAEARRDADASRAKTAHLERDLALYRAQGSTEGGVDGTGVGSASTQLTLLKDDLERLSADRERVGQQLEAALTHLQNLGVPVPPCILDGFVPEPAADGEFEEGADSSLNGFDGGARRVLQSAAAHSRQPQLICNNYPGGAALAVQVAAARNELAARDASIARLAAIAAEANIARLDSELRAQRLADEAATFEGRATRAALQLQRLARALETAGVRVVNAETGVAVLGEGGEVDLDGTLALLNLSGACDGEDGVEAGVAEDEFLPASAVLAASGGPRVSAVFAPAPARAASKAAPGGKA